MMVLAACGSDDAQDGAGYYDGQTITIVVPADPGNTQDITARFYAEWLPRYFDGEVTIVVENMPGGGQMLAPNYVAQQADRDGLTALLAGSTVHLSWRLGMPAVGYDLAELEPLASVGGGYAWAAHTQNAGIDDLDDLINGDHGPLFAGGQSVGGGDLFRLLPIHLLGIDFEVTWGYGGSADVFLAFQRGEANIFNTTGPSYRDFIDPLIETGEAVTLFSLGALEPDGSMVRDPEWPDDPHVGEVYEMMHGQPPSGPIWDALRLGLAVGSTLGRTLWTHADAPEEALQDFRLAIERALDDPEFVDAAIELFGQAPLIGQAVRDTVQNLLIDVDDSVIQFILDFAQEQYGTDLRDG